MTKREESWVRVIAVGIVVTAITIVWDLHGSVKVQASRMDAVESVLPIMAAEVTQIRITQEAAEISRKQLQNGAPYGY